MKDALALVELNLTLRATVGVDLVSMLAAHSPRDLTDALALVGLTKKYACGRDEVAAALKMRQQHNVLQLQYYNRNREELNKKHVEYMRQRRAAEKRESANKTKE